MLGLIAPKKEYYYVAKWVSNADRSQYAYFRFKIITDDNLQGSDLDNIGGDVGNGVWETKSGINFEPDDIVFFRGQKFNITNIDGSRKAEPEKEQAFAYFTTNGNIPITLNVRKSVQ